MSNTVQQHPNVASRGFLHQSIWRISGKRSHSAAMQHTSPIVFPDKRGKVKTLMQSTAYCAGEDPIKIKAQDHRIDIGDEKSDLLGYEVFSGKLLLEKKNIRTRATEQTSAETGHSDDVDAKLTSKALIWGSHVLSLEDVISVSYNTCFRHFIVHAYPVRKRSYGLSCFVKPQRFQQDLRFLASSSEEAIQWVQSFADQQCYVNCLPHPMVSGKKHGSDDLSSEPLYPMSYIKCKIPPRILVILNPQSGHGRSSKVFHSKVEPIFMLAGFIMEVVKTKYAGHARELASTVDYSTCPDGIVCVGGDGIVNEVLNGLLTRDDKKEAIPIPIGIIPAGSDNSLVWTVLGIRDPISAAMAIVKGGLTALDVFAVEWIQTGAIHFGSTVSYFGFLSDVLELSEKYQKNFGPLRYFVAGFLKFLCLPQYGFELEYLPVSKDRGNLDGRVLEQDKIDGSDLYKDVLWRSRKEAIPRASSLSSIESIMSPNRIPGGDMDTSGITVASSEPSDYVRGLDPKTKRLSLGRNNLVDEPDEVVHPQPHLFCNSNWPRTRSKSRTEKNWTNQTATNDSGCSCAAATSSYDKEDISSTVSDPGPVWDSEPKWDSGPKWDAEPRCEADIPIELPGPPADRELLEMEEPVPSLEDKWVVKKGKFLGVLVCNHSCKTVQSLSSQVVAPKALHDDKTLDLLLVGGSGRFSLLRFFICLQFGRHLSLPYVDYVKVKSVKIKPGTSIHNGVGIDGELRSVKGQVLCFLLPEQCRLIGRPAIDSK